MRRRYIDSIAENMAQEPGGAIAYIGFVAAGAWYLLSWWASEISSDGFGEGLFHLIVIGAAIMCAILSAGASLHEIDQVGHSGRMVTAYLWWYALVSYAGVADLSAWGTVGLIVAMFLFEIPLMIIENIACTFRRLGAVIRGFYRWGSVIIMFHMLAATLTSGLAAFIEHGHKAWWLESAYKTVRSIIIVGW